MSEDKNMTLRDEMETLLPFYLNGTLSGEDLNRIEDWIANDPDAAEALIEAESEFAFVTQENDSLRPQADAFRRFSEQLEKEPGPAVSPLSRLSAWLGKTFAVPAPLVWATAAATLALLVFATNTINRTELGEHQVAGAGHSEAPAFALVSFKANAALGDIASLLQASGGQITSGPGSGNTFKVTLSVKTVSQYDAALATLSTSPLVEKVIAGKKPDEVK
jgi:anti-sigma factor RsiW